MQRCRLLRAIQSLFPACAHNTPEDVEVCICRKDVAACECRRTVDGGGCQDEIAADFIVFGMDASLGATLAQLDSALSKARVRGDIVRLS